MPSPKTHSHRHRHDVPHPHAFGRTASVEHEHDHRHTSYLQGQRDDPAYAPVHRNHHHTQNELDDMRRQQLGESN
jgi:hypothetical protein